MSNVSRKVWISGRVQGVGFRWSTRQKALELKLSGYAKNLSDGRVEVMANGPEDAVNSLVAWLRQGPRTAAVNDIMINDVSDTSFNGFTIA